MPFVNTVDIFAQKVILDRYHKRRAQESLEHFTNSSKIAKR